MLMLLQLHVNNCLMKALCHVYFIYKRGDVGVICA